MHISWLYIENRGACIMKKCPICNQKFTKTMILRRKFSQSTTDFWGEHLEDGKNIIRCPHCKSRLIKKKSIWFIISLIPFVLSTGIYVITHQYEFLIILSVVFFTIIYINLPYSPYDSWYLETTSSITSILESVFWDRIASFHHIFHLRQNSNIVSRLR